jgi:hypothetical protein
MRLKSLVEYADIESKGFFYLACGPFSATIWE